MNPRKVIFMILIRIALALCFSAALSYHGIRKKTLSHSGAFAAVTVGRLVPFDIKRS